MYSSTSISRETPQTPKEARPYRSHKFPACERCRKRKLRCAVDVAGQPCNSCTNSGSICTQPQKEEEVIPSAALSHDHESSSQNHANNPAKRRHAWQDNESLRHSESEDRVEQQNILTSLRAHNHGSSSAISRSRDESNEASGSKSAMFVGPVMAEDVQMIQNYMSSRDRLPTESGNRVYDTVSDNPKDPVLYLTVPRRREGLSLNNRPGEKQLEILEQILGPLTMDVVGLYVQSPASDHRLICLQLFRVHTPVFPRHG
jgi:hypothetical protein